MHIEASNNDPNAIRYMQVYVDGIKKYEVISDDVITDISLTVGPHRITVQTKDSAGNLFKKTINITVVAAPSGISLTPPSLNFGSQTVNTASASQAIQLKNSGSADVTINSIVALGDYFASNNCSTLLAAGTNCTINVTFQPSAPGTRGGTVTVNDSAAGSPHLASLTGFGAATGACSPGPVNQTVTMCSPAPGSTVPSPVHIQAAATDSNSVNYVQVYVDGVRKAQSPGSILDTYLDMPTGTHRLTAQAKDSAGVILKATVYITVVPPPLSISPSSATVNIGGTQSFQASAAVTWSVDNVAGGNISVGTIDSSGLYTAPASPGMHSVQAAAATNIAAASVTVVDPGSLQSVYTYHNDNARTGQNIFETVLTKANVNANTFGKVYTYAVDGAVFAQPLYVASVSIPGQGAHNVVYVATEHDSVYAFDADNQQTAPLWQVSFIDPANGITPVPGADVNASAEWGITSTPVIDPSSGTIFVLERTKNTINTTYAQHLHALDIATGAEKFGGPVLIQASVPGTGEGSINGALAFDALRENNRAALLLQNGVVYIAWASLSDTRPYHGWVLAYSASTLALVGTHVDTPNGIEGGIWMSGGGLAGDGQSAYYISGNGTVSAPDGGSDYGEAFVRLQFTNGSLGVADWFIPYNYADLNAHDTDLGCGGPTLLPDNNSPHPRLIVGGGKQGTIYLLDRDSLGHFNAGSDSQIVQSIPALTVAHNHSTPAYWNNYLYFIGEYDVPKAYLLQNGLMGTSPSSQNNTQQYFFPGATPSVSANGTSNGIMWAIDRDSTIQSVLHAYDANDISIELYNSNQVASRDAAGAAVKFTVPTIVNGKVFVGTKDHLIVYGLLP